MHGLDIHRAQPQLLSSLSMDKTWRPSSFLTNRSRRSSFTTSGIISSGVMNTASGSTCCSSVFSCDSQGPAWVQTFLPGYGQRGLQLLILSSTQYQCCVLGHLHTPITFPSHGVSKMQVTSILQVFL